MKRILVLLGIFGLFFVIGLVSSSFFVKPQVDHQQALFLGCDPLKVVGLRIKNPKGAFVELHREKIPAKGNTEYRLQNAQWKIEQPSLGEANSSLVARTIQHFCAIEKYSYVSEEDFSNIGLQKERAFIEFVLENGKTRKILVAERIGGTRTAIVTQIDGQWRAASIPVALKQILAASANKWANKRIMRMPAGMIQAIRITTSNEKQIKLVRHGDSWKLDKKEKMEKTDELQKFVNRLASLQAVSILNPHQADLCTKETGDIAFHLEGLRNLRETIYVQKNKKGPGYIGCSTKRQATMRIHADFKRYFQRPVEKLSL